MATFTVDMSSCPCCGITTPCCANAIPRTLFVTFSGATGGCTCLNAASSFSIVYNPGTGLWTGTYTACGGTRTFDFNCLQLQWVVSQSTGCTFPQTNPSSVTCSPFSVTFAGILVSNCCSGNVTITITQ